MAEDQYTLPQTNPCYSTLEAFKHFTADALEAVWRAYWYGEYAERIEQWQACCPELHDRSAKLRPEKRDFNAVQEWELPDAIATLDSPCLPHLYYNKMPADQDSRGKAWFKHREAFSKTYFEQQYSGLANDLHACCLKKFNRCLETLQERFARQGTAEAGGVERCVREFSPEHQQASAAPAPPSPPAASVAAQEKPAPPPADNPCAAAARASGDQALTALTAERDGLRQELTRSQQIRSEMAQTYAELRQSCEQSKAGEQQTARDLRKEITLLARQNDAHQAEGRRTAAERDRLQASLAAAAPRPGGEALLAFPAGPASLELGLIGAAALAGGFLLGLPGRRGRRRQLLSAAVSALLTLLVFLGIVFFLPDTRRPDLLLAGTGAVLFATARALLRVSVLLRRHRQGPAPLSP